MKGKAAVALLIGSMFLFNLPALGDDDFCAQPSSAGAGEVSGLTAMNGHVCEYRGIPYAAPPVGELRWAPPRDPEPWKGIRLADSFGDICMQKGDGNEIPLPGGESPGKSEDCLYLNVWRPAKSGSFPVMVWIHGGSLTSGAGSLDMYRGDRLAALEDVVVVTINYRLGQFGFLALPELETESDGVGNYGLMDQIKALEWVKANISSFGGDAGNVTIFGESAGGWSVCNLLASPRAKGKFDKAILESGGCDTVLTRETALDKGRLFAADLGCAGENKLACLRSRDANEILAGKAEDKEKKKKGLAGVISFTWVPTVDGVNLTQTPIAALESGSFNRVPFMVGSNRDEVKLFTIVAPGIRMAPKPAVKGVMEEALGDKGEDEFRTYYPMSSYKRPVDAALHGVGDAMLGCKCYEAAEAVSRYEPVYFYRFDFDGHRMPNMVGAAHGVEIMFAFSNLDRPPSTLFVSEDMEDAYHLSDDVRTYWASFARDGDPNSFGLPQWPKYSSDKKETMVLDVPLHVEKNDFEPKCEFWKEYASAD